MSLLLIMLVPFLVAVYTFNYCSWAWRKGLRRGAFGLALLGAATLVVPGVALMITR